MVHRNTRCAGSPSHATGERARPRVPPTVALAGWRCASDSTERCRYFSDASVWLAGRQPLHARARALPARLHDSRAVLGLGLVDYIMPAFSPAPGKSQTGKCALARRGATSFCFLPPSGKMWSKNNTCSEPRMPSRRKAALQDGAGLPNW